MAKKWILGYLNQSIKRGGAKISFKIEQAATKEQIYNSLREFGFSRAKAQKFRILYDKDTILKMIFASEDFLTEQWMSYSGIFEDKYLFLSKVIYDNTGVAVSPQRLESLRSLGYDAFKII